jgi:hypothetical protein
MVIYRRTAPSPCAISPAAPPRRAILHESLRALRAHVIVFDDGSVPTARRGRTIVGDFITLS